MMEDETEEVHKSSPLQMLLRDSNRGAVKIGKF